MTDATTDRSLSPWWNRPLSDDERALLTHVSMHGSDGYPVVKLRRSSKWDWTFRNCRSPILFPTKREAVAHFERFLGVLRDALAGERFREAEAAARSSS